MKTVIFLVLATAVLMVESRPDSSGFFIKAKSIPRTGRSYDGWEATDGMEGSEDRYMRPFVISPPTGKVIPRMGRRNMDSEGMYDIPKFDDFGNQDPEKYTLVYSG